MVKITHADHLVLNVADVERALDFYTSVLGLEPERVEAFHSGEVPFPSVRVNHEFVIDLFPHSDESEAKEGWRENLNHFCLVVDRETFEGLPEHLKAHDMTIEVGPVPRWGAQGMGLSIYIRDPDSNEIELRTYK